MGRSRRGGKSKNRQEVLQQLFARLQQGTSIDPFQRWRLERDDGSVTPRVVDLVAPIGRGQRCMVVAPPKAGKTTLLIEICQSLRVNHPEAQVYALLVNERPEEVTHFRRSTHAQVHAASSDQMAKDHVHVVEDSLEEILSPVFEGRDVVLLLDSITRLARAYNTVQAGSGRTLTGGLDAATMQLPRRLFGAARKIENGGSLTIVATALVQTGSKMDDIIFEEFKGTGNTEIVFSRELFEQRIFPSIDIAKSGTRKEEKLNAPEVVEVMHKLRRALVSLPPDQAMESLLAMLERHPSNVRLLEAVAESAASIED